MVIYFSKSGVTKRYVEALALAKGDSLFEIKPLRPLGGNFSNAIKSVLKREADVLNMPDLTNADTIYLCSPVWGGGFPPPMRYFVRNANLQGKTVKLLLTCNTVSDGYVKEFETQLRQVDVALYNSIVFSGKKTPEPTVDRLMSF